MLPLHAKFAAKINECLLMAVKTVEAVTVEVTAAPPKGMLPIIATWRSLKTEQLGPHAITLSAATTWTTEFRDKPEVGMSSCHGVNILRCTPLYTQVLLFLFRAWRQI